MAKPIHDGGPAFPFGQVSEVSGQPINGYHNDGMTLRDYFAAKAPDCPTDGPELAAMMGIAEPDWMNGRESFQWWIDAKAKWSYRYADAMLAARESKPEPVVDEAMLKVLAQRDAMVEALEKIRQSAQTRADLYADNGPEWTSQQTGDEYYSASTTLGDAHETIARCDQALASVREASND